MARGMVTPAQAPMPWTKRATISHSIDGARLQPMAPIE